MEIQRRTEMHRTSKLAAKAAHDKEASGAMKRGKDGKMVREDSPAQKELKQSRDKLGLLDTYKRGGLWDMSPLDGVNKLGKETTRRSVQENIAVSENMGDIYRRFRINLKDEGVVSASDVFVDVDE